MKKILVLSVIVFQILSVSCGGGNRSETADSDMTDDDTDEISDTEVPLPDEGGSDSDNTETNGDGDTVFETDTDTDTDTDTEQENGEPEKNAEGCYIFTVDGSTFSKYYSNTYLGYVKDNILGDKNMVDKFEIDTFQPRTSPGVSHPGTYDLGSGDNKSYYDCTECVKVMQDHDGKHADKLFFQESGTLVIEEVDGDNNIKGTITAKLVEVTIDEELGEAVPVKNGGCIAIENWSFNSSDKCVPDCAGKVCGDDGCGGICNGGCGKDAYCNEAQTQCLPFVCQQLSFENIKTRKNESNAGYYEAYAVGGSAGSTDLDDILTLHFYDEYANYADVLSPGVIDLGSGSNTNYRTCTECILFYEDVDFEIDEEEEQYQKLYFQQSGELVFEEVRDGTFESKGHGSFRLVEVDEFKDFAPVQGGNCYEVANMTWDTICIPSCDGKICGPDGCGGECGPGCGIDESCNAGQTACIPYDNCEKITIGELLGGGAQVYPEDKIYSYQYGYTPNTGNPELSDSLRLALYTQVAENHKYNLAGTNLRSCDVCFSVYEDGQTMFFQQKGEITFGSFNPQTGVFEAGIKNLRLVEITIDEDYSSVPVLGGKCFEINNETLKYTK